MKFLIEQQVAPSAPEASQIAKLRQELQRKDLEHAKEIKRLKAEHSKEMAGLMQTSAPDPIHKIRMLSERSTSAPTFGGLVGGDLAVGVPINPLECINPLERSKAVGARLSGTSFVEAVEEWVHDADLPKDVNLNVYSAAIARVVHQDRA